jgi:hypothetical protein
MADLTELGQEAIAAVSRGVADGAPLVKCQLSDRAGAGCSPLSLVSALGKQRLAWSPFREASATKSG